MSGSSVRHFLQCYKTTSTSQYHDILDLLPSLSYTHRKKLMMIARARRYPIPGTTLHQQTEPTLRLLSQLLPNVQKSISDLITTPMIAGFFLSSVLSAPYERKEVSDLKKELMWKEVSVMESTPRENSVSWDNIYTAQDPWSVDFDTDRFYNRLVQNSLQKWHDKHRNRVLYPSTGNKSVSFRSRENLEMSMGREIDGEVDVTSLTLEYYYSRTGIKIEGSCEMKQRWYPTQASPRTYYAQGGTAYHTSKYLRTSLNWLCDTFRPTHRKDRVSPSGISCRGDEDEVYIYDLASFTSLFHEHRSFLNFLARNSCGVEVTIFDSWEGPLVVNLSDLIWEYLEANVSQPTYETKIPDLACMELTHSIAGFLGVYGNLASCTYPHGICLGTVTKSESRSWCAGDDAGSCDRSDLKGHGTRTVGNTLGKLAIEKVFIASEPGALALKRLISLLGKTVYQHANILWPILSVMDDSDFRFKLSDVAHPWERVVGAIVSFFRSMESCPISSSDISFACQFFTELYNRYNLPLSGWYPPLTGYTPWKVTIPRISESVFGRNPLTVLVESFYSEQYLGPMVDDIPWRETELKLGQTWSSNSAEHLSYLVKLGYVTRELNQCLYEGKEGFSRSLLDATRPQHSFFVYTYSVIDSIPFSLQILSPPDSV